MARTRSCKYDQDLQLQVKPLEGVGVETSQVAQPKYTHIRSRVACELCRAACAVRVCVQICKL